MQHPPGSDQNPTDDGAVPKDPSTYVVRLRDGQIPGRIGRRRARRAANVSCDIQRAKCFFSCPCVLRCLFLVLQSPSLCCKGQDRLARLKAHPYMEGRANKHRLICLQHGRLEVGMALLLTVVGNPLCATPITVTRVNQSMTQRSICKAWTCGPQPNTTTGKRWQRR